MIPKPSTHKRFYSAAMRFRLGKYAWLFLGLLITAGAMAAFWPCKVFMETTVMIPVGIHHLRAGFVHMGLPAKGIEFQIRGPESIVHSIEGRNYRYLFDLSGVTEAVISLPVDANRIDFPEGIEVLQTIPSSVTVTIEREEKKDLPVMVTTAGEPMPGYRVEKISLTPSSVVLRGSESILADMESVSTKPIELTGARESFKKNAILSLPETLHSIPPDKIFIAEIEIAEKICTKTFTGIPITGRGSPYEFRIEPETLDLEIKGPERNLTTGAPEKDVSASVDLSGLPPGQYTVPAAIVVPVHLMLMNVRPKNFIVTIINKLSQKE